MNSPNNKLNKQISKHYVDHACNISSPGQVSKELDLPPPRISELRKGMRQLTAEQAEIIKMNYGIPSTTECYWMEAELTSLEALGKDFIDNGLMQNLIRLVTVISDDEFIDMMLEDVSVDTKRIKGFVDLSLIDKANKHNGTSQKNKRLERVYKLKVFNKLLADMTFQNWCAAANRILAEYPNTQDLKFFEDLLYNKDIFSAQLVEGRMQWDFPTTDFTTLPRIFSSIEEGFRVSLLKPSSRPSEAISRLSAICQLKRLIDCKTYAHIFTSQSSFSFGTKLGIEKGIQPVKEYAIAGKCVWNSSEQSERYLELNQPKSEKGVVDWVPLISYADMSSEDLAPLSFTHAEIKLFYTEQYQYLVALGLATDEFMPPKRCLLIKIENRQKVFDDLLAIFEHFDIAHEFTMKHIKKAVAANGGYIPSAIYIH